MVESHPERAARWQHILNARPIPDRELQHQDREPIPVRIRLVWQRDGEQWADSVAIDWVGRDVLVQVDWRRVQVGWAWIDAGDVVRR